MTTEPTTRTADRLFERKIVRAKLAGAFEQLWLKLWLVLAVAAAFLVVSYLGVWPYLPVALHVVLLGAFGVALLAALASMARIRWPTRDEAIRRIERVSGVPHRPATSYEDTVSAPSSDPATAALWQAHRARMAALLARLRPGAPRPRTDRFDPFAARAALLLGVVALTGLLGSNAMDRVKAAFSLNSGFEVSEARLDAWLTPPTYTGRPPVMLADGAGSAKAQSAAGSDGGAKAAALEVPVKSLLIVRAGGMGHAALTVEIAPTPTKDSKADTASERVAAKPEEDARDLQEVRYEMKRSSTVRVLAGGSEIASWQIAVTPDQLP
jgi:uncharacterized protein (TIGR02302 family)